MDVKRLKPEEIYGKVVEAGETWADCDAAASILEETRKTVLAELMNQSQASSMAAKESAALADPVYRLHVTNMVNARKDANRAKVRFDGAKLLAELRRSEESSRRAELRGA